jgi:hypothetical protein
MDVVLKECYLCEKRLELENFNKKRKECKTCSKGMKLFYRYGITQEEYDELSEKQNNVCAICFRDPTEVGVLVVDHDHACCPTERSCGECVRALLCSYCNTSIGLMEDRPERLLMATEYLRSFTG